MLRNRPFWIPRVLLTRLDQFHEPVRGFSSGVLILSRDDLPISDNIIGQEISRRRDTLEDRPGVPQLGLRMLRGHLYPQLRKRSWLIEFI